jgi:phage host-nuclease inhibitor protein Gam
MKFYINSIHLWLDNNNHREIKFLKNKVNIITGEQSKGKSTIIEIIDYCFFASTCPIAEDFEYLNKVKWFGINFTINDKNITIIRHYKNLKDYFFSSSGEIPSSPFVNIKEENIKNTIMAEFGINDNVVFPFGGKDIKKGSKISPRFFMLFNTQRRNTLSSDEVLFDKQTIPRQQEALTRIFDIAIGATTIDNLIKQELLASKEKELMKLELKEENISKKTGLYDDEIKDIVIMAKKLNLVDLPKNDNDAIDNLKEYFLESEHKKIINNQIELQDLEEKKLEKSIQLTKYKKYIKQYNEYKKLLKNDLDSLKPISYINENYQEILETENLSNFIESLNNEFNEIKNFVNKKTLPSVKNLEEEIEKLTNEVSTLVTQINGIKNDELSKLKNDQLMFLGEVKVKLNLYNEEKQEKSYTKQIENLKTDIENLKGNIKKIDRSDILDTLSEYMQEVFQKVKFELSGYSGYKPIYDYKSKLIHLKKIDEKVSSKDIKNIIKNIGSSSNHLFLHLSFFSAIHRLIVKQNIHFVPQFLILDQPDSPYYDTSNKDSAERKVFFKALKVLDNHIELFIKELKKDFQIIVLEHVDWKEIKEENFNYYHLVEEWRDDNSGLVPKYLLENINNEN